MTAGSPPRRAALSILRAVRSDTPFEIALDAAVAPLSPVDAGLAHELAAGALRHRRTLDAAFRPLVKSPWNRVEPDVRDLLRIGAYQILNLDRVPAFAAVQTTVEVTKREAPRATGLVNAVLRRLSDAPRPPDPSDLAERYSHPDWIVRRWIDRFGEARAERLLSWNNQRPRLTLRPVRWTLDRLHTSLEHAEIELDRTGDLLRLRTPGPVAELPGYSEGAFMVQDGGQARLIDFAHFDEGATIWDACAAPGGKTMVLATNHPVVASDLDTDRLRRLTENLNRIRCSAVRLAADVRHPPFRTESFSAVLVDAPCTGTGTIQRHPDARWRLNPERLQRATQLQSKILDGVAPVVSPGGLLVYLTCSLEADENEHRVDRFLSENRDFTREGDDLFIFPTDHDTDGGYGARLRRRA